MKTNQINNSANGLAPLLHPRAIDGDAVEAWTEVFPGIRVRHRFRLKGFYAPELDGGIPDQGKAAKELLQAILDRGRCAVNTDKPRQDRYGRWVVTLYEDGKAIDPFTAIFPYNLTEAQHAEDLALAKRNRSRNGGAL